MLFRSRIVDRYNALVAELCRQERWLYVPVAENMRCGTECFRDICHMHLTAMERKARIVADALEGHIQPPTAASAPRAEVGLNGFSAVSYSLCLSLPLPSGRGVG